MGVYNKIPLSCNGHSDENLSLLVKKPLMDLLFILCKHSVHILNCKAVNNHQNKNVTILKKYQIFLEPLKYSKQSKYNCVASIDV